MRIHNAVGDVGEVRAELSVAKHPGTRLAKRGSRRPNGYIGREGIVRIVTVQEPSELKLLDVVEARD